MCLRTVERRLTKVAEKSGRGYKVFYRTQQGRLKAQIRHTEPEPYRCGVWYTAKGRTRISTSNGKTYTPGFHIFTKLKDAIRYAGSHDVHLVEYRKARYIGQQSISILLPRAFGECIIAGEMKIIKRVQKI